jgi:hypothetical protein
MTLESLKAEAAEGCEWRGHELATWFGDDRAAVATCNRCGMQVAVNVSPPPNGIDIGGEAVALNCRRESEVYKAMLSRGMVSRYVTVAAANESEAYRMAKDLCGEDEFVRGVNA